MFWNLQGLNDPEKKSAIFEAIKDYKLVSVGLDETRKSSYSNVLLNSLFGNFDFTWGCPPARWFAGGVLIGINNDVYDIIEMDCGIYYVRCLVRYKMSGKIWNIVFVYSAPHDKDN
jgi:hypothetical protein